MPLTEISAARRKRTLLLAKGFPPDVGGVEQYSFELAKRIPNFGFRTFVITQHTGAVGLTRRGAMAILNVGSGPQLMIFIRMLCIVLKLRKRAAFDFAFATTWRVAIPLLIARINCPIGITIHGREILMPSGILAWLMRRVMKRANVIFAVSDFTLRQARIRGLISKNCTLVRNWNGISEKQLEIQSCTLEQVLHCDLLLLSLSRLVERKNLGAAIKAFASFQSKHPEADMKYVIAGDGPEMESLKSLAIKICKDKSVIFAGRVSEGEKALLYSKGKIFLHPHISLHGGRDVEGFGLVIAEAMDWGLAVIAGKDGGASDFVDDHVTGLIVDGTDVQAITAALSTLFSDRKLIEKLGKSAKEWVLANLSWDKHTAIICKQMCDATQSTDSKMVR